MIVTVAAWLIVLILIVPVTKMIIIGIFSIFIGLGDIWRGEDAYGHVNPENSVPNMLINDFMKDVEKGRDNRKKLGESLKRWWDQGPM